MFSKEHLGFLSCKKTRSITADGYKAYPVAIRELQEEKYLPHAMPLRVKKYLNNIIEQDRRHVKKRFAKSTEFQSIRHASRTLKGVETVRALYKRKRILQQPNFVFSMYNELHYLLTIA